MSCERFFVEFPPQVPLAGEELLDKSLALVYPKEIRLHPAVFLVPFEQMMLVKTEKKRLWSEGKTTFEYNPATILRKNIKFMINKTRNFGLLVSQFTWVGLLNIAERRHVLHLVDELQLAALYIIMLKKEGSWLTHFLDCLHITGNHVIANTIEAKLELLEENIENFEQKHGHCSCSDDDQLCDECEHNAPPKKRKTSSDSNITDEEEDDDEDPDMESSFAAAAAAAAISSMNGYAQRKQQYKCHIKPLDAVELIAIINGKEDCNSKVELCKCGNYHQYPKWKDVNSRYASITKESSYMTNSDGVHASTSSSSACSSTSMMSKLVPTSAFYNSNSRLVSYTNYNRKGILRPESLSERVEVGLDLSHGMPAKHKFTEPRRSCTHLKLRFSTQNSFSEHPDNIAAVVEAENKNAKGLMSKLPRFLRMLL